MSHARLAAVVGGVELGYRVTERPYVCALVTWSAALAGGGPGVFRVASWHLSLRNAETSLRQLFNRAGRRGYVLCACVVAVRPAESFPVFGRRRACDLSDREGLELGELLDLEGREAAGEALSGYSRERKHELTMKLGNCSERGGRGVVVRPADAGH